jgi:hypothetical protein
MQSPGIPTRLRPWSVVAWAELLVCRACLSTLLFPSVQALAGQDLQFRVHVVDPQYENVERARVDIVSDRESRTASTGVDGTVTFANLRSGRYNMRVGAPGFTLWVRDQDITAQQERPLVVTLKPGVLSCEPHYSIEYDNQPGSPVRGMVIASESGKGVRGLKIQLWLPDEKTPIVTLLSQKKGLFEMPEIASGRYRLRVADTRNSDSTYQDEQVNLVLPTQDAPFITVTMRRKGHIEVCE